MVTAHILCDDIQQLEITSLHVYMTFGQIFKKHCVDHFGKGKKNE